MSKRMGEGRPALLAVGLLVLAELMRFFAFLSQNWNSVEFICNAVMIGIAVFFSGKEWFPGQEQPPSSRRVVGIISVSLLAFPMNIDVFKHTIRLEHLREDLWSWHGFWIAFAVLQLLVLTPLGKEIIKQLKLFFAQITGLLRWGKSITVRLGNIFPNLLDRVLELLKTSSKKMIFTITLGLFLWVCWLSVQIPGQDIRVLLTDTAFIGKNLLVWIDYLLVAMLIALLPLVTQKAKKGILSLDERRVLVVIAAVVGLAASALLLPFLLSVAWAMIVLIGVLVAVVKWASKRDRQKFGEKDSGGSKTGGLKETGEKGAPMETAVRKRDMMVLLVFFTAVPLCALALLALFAFVALGGQGPASTGPSNPVSCLELCKTMLEIANGIIQLFGIG